MVYLFIVFDLKCKLVWTDAGGRCNLAGWWEWFCFKIRNLISSVRFFFSISIFMEKHFMHSLMQSLYTAYMKQ